MGVVELIWGASFTVKMVMLLLVLASMVSWYMIVNRFIYFRNARDEMYLFEERFWSGGDLYSLYNQISPRSENLRGLANIFVAGFQEFTRLRKKAGADPTSVVEGAQRCMRVALSREMDELEVHLSFLATVGSTSPYVGLFGTVWGIMNTFHAIGATGSTSIVTVAPGIAEARDARLLITYPGQPPFEPDDAVTYEEKAEKNARKHEDRNQAHLEQEFHVKCEHVGGFFE